MSWIFGVNKEQAVPQNFEQMMAQGGGGGNPGIFILYFFSWLLSEICF